MIKNNQNLVIVLLILLNFFTLFKLNSLENSMDRSLQENNNTISNLGNEINNIYANVDKMLEKQMSILDAYNVEFAGEMDSDKLTVPVAVSITPKEYSDGLTASLQINSENIAMENEGISFSAYADLKVFGSSQIKVILEQDGIRKTETLEEFNDLQNKYLLDIQGGFNGNSSYRSGKFMYDGKINLFIIGSQEDNIEKVTVIKDINGSIIGEQKIEDLSGDILIDIDDEVELGASDKFNMYVDVQDKYGLNYKYIIMTYEIDSKGEDVNNYPEWSSGSIVEIIDKNGKALYTPEYISK